LRARSLLAGLVFAGGLILAPVAQANELLPKTEEIVRLFHDVVFKTESGFGSDGKPVVKWVSPIQIYVHQFPGAEYLTQLEALMKQLSRLTGLPITRVSTPTDANLQLHFLPTSIIRERMKAKNLNCGGKLRGKRGEWTITSADVYISTESPERTEHCLVEELAQILGLTNDTRLTDMTIFNDQSKRMALSIPDQILIKTLYDPALVPGMSSQQAEPVARLIITNLRQRLIDNGVPAN